MTPLLVTAGIIEKDKMVLLSRRKPGSKFSAGQWEFPGGKVEHLETPQQSIIREIKEELDLQIRVEELVHVNSHIYRNEKDQLHVVLITYLCKIIDGKEFPKEGQTIKWVHRSHLSKLEWCEADIEICQTYLQSHK